MKTHYDVLGVQSNATAQEIKGAFRTISKQLHPDKNNGVSTEEYKQVIEADDVLSDPEKRAAYDAELAAVKAQTALQEGLNASSLFKTIESLGLSLTEAEIQQEYAGKFLTTFTGCFSEMSEAWADAKPNEPAVSHVDFLILSVLARNTIGIPSPVFNNNAYTDQRNLDDIWIRRHLKLRSLAWVEMVAAVRDFRANNLALSALKDHTQFVAINVRNGTVFRGFYDLLYLPILQNKSRLQTIQQMRKAKREKPSERCAQKIAQLDLALNEILAILHTGVRELMDLHKNQIKNDGPKDEAVLEVKRQEIFINAANKIREFEKKTEIAKNRNQISRFLKGILCAIPAALLAIPCVLTKTGRRAWMSMFYYNETEQALKSARRKLLEAKGPASAA